MRQFFLLSGLELHGKKYFFWCLPFVIFFLRDSHFPVVLTGMVSALAAVAGITAFHSDITEFQLTLPIKKEFLFTVKITVWGLLAFAGALAAGSINLVAIAAEMFAFSAAWASFRACRKQYSTADVICFLAGLGGIAMALRRETAAGMVFFAAGWLVGAFLLWRHIQAEGKELDGGNRWKWLIAAGTFSLLEILYGSWGDGL